MGIYTDVFVSNIQEINSIDTIKVTPETKFKAFNLIRNRFPDKEIHEEILEILDLMDIEEAV